LALCPDAKRKESRYSVQQYGEVIARLLAKGMFEKILLFTETEKSDYRQLEQYGAEWCRTDNVDEFIQKISCCQWVVTAEGGGAHIAGALGLRVVVLSGMGHQEYWRPYAEHVRVLEEKHGVSKIEPDEIISALTSLGVSENPRHDIGQFPVQL
jgi:ADP-heptose:LPS heptosyltransferase